MASAARRSTHDPTYEITHHPNGTVSFHRRC
jgi:hypothetical protein